MVASAMVWPCRIIASVTEFHLCLISKSCSVFVSLTYCLLGKCDHPVYFKVEGGREGVCWVSTSVNVLERVNTLTRTLGSVVDPTAVKE
jgi:hypothetical protein